MEKHADVNGPQVQLIWSWEVYEELIARQGWIATDSNSDIEDGDVVYVGPYDIAGVARYIG